MSPVARAQTAASGKIAFSSTRADLNTDVYLMNLDGTGIQRLTYDPAEDIHPALSPDGTKVAYSSTRGFGVPDGNSSGIIKSEIYVVNLDGTGLTKLTTMGGRADFPTWSPDSTQIAFVAGSQDSTAAVYKMSSTGGTPVRLVDSASGFHLQWSHTPAGDYIYFYGRMLSSNSEPHPIYRMNPDGANVLLQSRNNDHPLVYSPDGTLYFAFLDLRNVVIYRSSDNTQVGTVYLYSYTERLSFSADSKKLVFAGYYASDPTNRRHIYTVNVNGTGLTNLTFTAGVEDFPTCGPGMVVPVPEPATGFGKLVVAKQDGIYVLNPEGWGWQKLTPSAVGIQFSYPLQNPRWNHDGSRIAADDMVNIFTMAPDGSDLRQVTHTAAAAAIEPTWNFEGTSLAYQYRPATQYPYQERIHSVSLDGTNDTIISTGTGSFLHPSWQPIARSNRVAYDQFGGATASITVVDIGQENSAVYFTNTTGSGTNGDLRFDYPAWNTTGTRLAVVRFDNQDTLENGATVHRSSTNIVSVAADGTGLTNLTANPLSNQNGRPSYRSLTYSPDGQQIGFLDGGELTLLRLDGTGEKRLFNNGTFKTFDWGSNVSPAQDTLAPVVTITPVESPVTRKLMVLSGTIDDTAPFASGPAMVRLRLQRLSDGKYWEPALAGTNRWTTLVSEIPALFTAAGVEPPPLRNWSASVSDLPPAAAMASGSYRLTAYGIDNRGNLSAAVMSDFTIYKPGELFFSATSYQVNEASGVATPGPVVVRRANGTDGTVTVAYTAKMATGQGQATGGVDFILDNGTLTFGPGETAKALPLQILDDDLLERNEFLQIELSRPTGGADFGTETTFSITPIAVVINIEDDEVEKSGAFQFVEGISFVQEDAGTAQVVIQRTGGSIPADVSFTMSDGGGGFVHYTDVSQTIHFSASDTTKIISVPLINDSGARNDEEVRLTVVGPSSYRAGLLVIRDKDFQRPGGTFSFSAAAYVSNDKGQGIDLSVNRSGGTAGTIYLYVENDLTFSPGTAVRDIDYSLANYSLVFADGSHAPGTIHISIPSGVAAAGVKTISLRLTQDSHTIDKTTVTINHDSSAPGTFQVTSTAASATEGDTVAVTVNRTDGSFGAVNVPFTFQGTATKTSDYTADVSSPLRFADGQTSQQVRLTTYADQTAEAGETIIFTLGTPSKGNLGSNTTETITLADGPSGPSTLTVATVGSGTLSAGFLGTSQRIIGRVYTVTVTPATGYLFAGWSGGANSVSPGLSFTMTADLTLTATFVPNPYLSTTGTYQGLAQSAEGSSDPALVSLNLSGQGGFTGSISYPQAIRTQLPALGSKLPLAGAFTPLGHYSRTVKAGTIMAKLDLQHNPANGGSVTGTVIIGGTTFQVSALRAGYSVKHPTPLAGAYTVSMGTAGNAAAAPRGHGFAIVTVSPVGQLKMVASLADGTGVVLKGPLTGVANFTIFKPLYGNFGQFTGSWKVVPSAVSATSDILGDVLWMRPSGVANGQAHPYDAGFATMLSPQASIYTKPTTSLNIYGQALTTVAVDLTHSQAGSTPVRYTAMLNASGKLTYSGTDKIAGSIAGAGGLFTGTFTAAGSKSPTKLFGAFLPKLGLIRGYLLEGGVSGDLLISVP